jgi:DNA repair protein RadD
MLRPYQQSAHDAAIAWMRQTVAPGVVDAATGAGKSHIIAAIADTIHSTTGKRVLCLAPSAELVTQNREKYLATGNKASLFSASAGGKDLRHHVVFGSPLTVKNRISAFQRHGNDGFALVIVDECHGLTPTLIGIIEAMREANPNLRVLGLTATPYRLGSGYIFREWPDAKGKQAKVNGDDVSRDPYFQKCIIRIDARELIEAGFLTPPVIGGINAKGYDTAGLTANAQGKFDSAAVDRAYHGHGRKTSAIVADVLAQSRGRKGVMFFAATVQHANEVMASLPPELSAIVTGETPKAMRDNILARFKSRALKYLVNVSVLTTGFDAPHVDVIAILRKTESVGLLQQIIGRGLRLDDVKVDCLVLDYTSNLDDHCPDGDLFAPAIKANKGGGAGGGVTCICPECSAENTFTANPQYLDYELDEAGYVLDLEGQQILVEQGPIPGHFGRRCFGQVRTGSRGEYERCGYRWTGKECPACQAHNDIAARYCCECRAEIVDPNERLIGDFKAMKKDPTRRQCDEVLSMTAKPGTSQTGKRTVRVDWVTPYRSFSTWLQPDATHSRGMQEFAMWQVQTQDGDRKPYTVSYVKDANSGFYRCTGYNETIDAQPDGYEHKEKRGDRKQGHWFDADEAVKAMGAAQ